MRIPPEKLDPRLAGEVVRYHTELTLRPQTVAAHCWNVIRLLLVVWPDAPRHLIVEALFHDVGEGFAGDSPSPAKTASPALRGAVAECEGEARLGMAIPWGVPAHAPLSAHEENVLRLVDLLDAWEHCVWEVSSGNRFADVMVRRCDSRLRGWLSEAGWTPDGVAERARAYMARRAAVEAERGA